MESEFLYEMLSRPDKSGCWNVINESWKQESENELSAASLHEVWVTSIVALITQRHLSLQRMKNGAWTSWPSLQWSGNWLNVELLERGKLDELSVTQRCYRFCHKLYVPMYWASESKPIASISW